MSKTFIHDTYECLVLGRSVISTVMECADWVVTASHDIFMKFFYFVAILSDVIFSIKKRKICVFILLQFYIENCIYYLFRDLGNFCHTYELYTWVLLDCLLFHKFFCFT